MEGISRTLAAALVSPPLERAREVVAGATRQGQVLLVPSDAAFPAMLRTIPDPPPVLFARGDLAWLERPAVAIIGSRAHSRYGADVATALATVAARAGAVVVSGMARGLDAIAQRAALEAGGGTIGVLGTGADVAYPAANRELHRQVLGRGLLLTESPPGTSPQPGAFPRRNRIISGLARWLVVVEAADGSGTMITVTTALEQGREVLAVPGPITSPTSRGTNRLLRDGATPLLAPEDLAAVLGAAVPPARGVPDALPVPCTLSAEEARVLGAVGREERGVDLVAEGAGLPIGATLGALLGLELAGLVEQLPGGSYRRRVAWGGPLTPGSGQG